MGSGANLYAYVRNGPTNLVDPTGKFAFAVAAGCGLGIVGYFFGLLVTNDQSRNCENLILGGIGACVTGAASVFLGGTGVFEKAGVGLATGLVGNWVSQATSRRPPDPRPFNLEGATSYGVAGFVGAVTNATPAGSFFQGFLVAGTAGAAEPAVNKFIEEAIKSIRWR